MKALFLCLSLSSLTLFLSAQDFKSLIPISVSIMDSLKIKVRSSFNENSRLPKTSVNEAKKGYSADFNMDYSNPIISMSNYTYLLCNNPDQYYSFFNVNEIPPKIKFIDSLRHISSVMHELTHFLEDTTYYNLKELHPSLYCKDGEVFCSVRFPSEFNAYTVCASFVLKTLNQKRYDEIMSMKKSIKEKKVDIINEVYLTLYKLPDFIRPLTVEELL